MDRGTWWATVHGVTKSQAQLSNLTTTWCSVTFVPWEEQPQSGCLLMLGWRSGMLVLACLLLGAAVLLFHSSGPNLVHLLLAKYTRSLQWSLLSRTNRGVGTEINVLLSEAEAQGVFQNLGKRFHGGKLRRKVEGSSQQAGDESCGVPFFRSHQKLRKYFFQVICIFISE